jgi:hypothetical protein
MTMDFATKVIYTIQGGYILNDFKPAVISYCLLDSTAGIGLMHYDVVTMHCKACHVTRMYDWLPVRKKEGRPHKTQLWSSYGFGQYSYPLFLLGVSQIIQHWRLCYLPSRPLLKWASDRLWLYHHFVSYVFSPTVVEKQIQHVAYVKDEENAHWFLDRTCSIPREEAASGFGSRSQSHCHMSKRQLHPHLLVWVSLPPPFSQCHHVRCAIRQPATSLS